jgi:prefoldin subunit 4
VTDGWMDGRAVGRRRVKRRRATKKGRAMSTTNEVTWEDQQRICAFSRMNARHHELNAEIKTKEKQIDDLDEASTELVVNDEDETCVLVGECFVKMDNDAAEGKVEKMLAEAREGLEKLKTERKVLREGMDELKQVRRR